MKLFKKRKGPGGGEVDGGVNCLKMRHKKVVNPIIN